VEAKVEVDLAQASEDADRMTGLVAELEDKLSKLESEWAPTGALTLSAARAAMQATDELFAGLRQQLSEAKMEDGGPQRDRGHGEQGTAVEAPGDVGDNDARFRKKDEGFFLLEIAGRAKTHVETWWGVSTIWAGCKARQHDPSVATLDALLKQIDEFVTLVEDPGATKENGRSRWVSFPREAMATKIPDSHATTLNELLHQKQSVQRTGCTDQMSTTLKRTPARKAVPSRSNTRPCRWWLANAPSATPAST